MNPFSLLSKGETVKGLRNRRVSYKMLGHNILPNFSSPRQASPTTPRPEAAAAASPTPAATEEKPSEPLTGLTGGMPTPKEEGPSKPSQQRDAAATMPDEQPSRPGFWSGLWRIAVSRIGNWLPRRKAASGLPSVQTELALAKVTVIRNDLSDDDLEVVVGKKAGKKTEKPAQSEEVERENLTPNP